jgi:iron complex outermembrane recepter protein
VSEVSVSLRNHLTPAITMKGNSLRIALLCGSLTGPFLSSASSQGNPPTAATPVSKEDPVNLPAFVINENAANPYQSQQALSASRVAMSIQDIPQTVSIVTSEFIKDSMSLRILDAAKYITPVVESSLPIGGDRYMIRGFQVSHEFIDGAEISGADGYSMALAPYNIERVEVIKGPNAILVPGGSPGGQFNPITKSPTGKNFANATLEFAQYYGTGANFDVNRVVSGDGAMAVRFVGAVWHSDGYADRQFRHGYLFAPSFSWQLSPMHKLVVKAEIMQNRETRRDGLSIDPSVGSDGYAIIARGLPSDFSFGAEADTRHRATERVTAELFSTLNNHLTSRLQVIADHIIRRDAGGTTAAVFGANLITTRNPNTGKFEPGTIWSLDQNGPTAIATSVVSPLPAPSSYVFQRNYDRVYLQYTEAHIRNDYALKFDTDAFKTNTVLGFAGNTSKVHFVSYTSLPAVAPDGSRPAIAAANLGAITFPNIVWVAPSIAAGGDRTGKQNDAQFYLYENASFLRDRVQVSGGVSRYFGTLSRVDNTGIAIPVPYYPEYSLSETAKTFGLVVKPISQVSLFYGYNTSGGTMPGSLSAGTIAPSFKISSGNQKEYGVKTSLLNNTLTASFSHFDISQKNYAVPNSQYYADLAAGLPVVAGNNNLYADLISKGWEFEGTYSLARNLTIVGNYTSFKMRQPGTNTRIRAVPDKSYGAYVDYRFTEGVLTGFGVNIGADYKSDVTGETPSGFTTTKPLPGGVFVPNQATFLVAPRTITNLGFSYTQKDWTARLTITNLTDKDYIQAAGSRTSLVVGDPRSFRSSITYRF